MKKQSSYSNRMIIKRLFSIAWNYRLQIALGWLSLGIMTSLLSFLMILTKPLVNIATNSANAGERTWLRLKEYISYLPSWLPIEDWGRALIENIPTSLDLGGHQTPILFCLLVAGFFCSIFMGVFQFLGYYLTHRVIFRALTDLRNKLNSVLIHQKLSYYDQWRPGELMSKILNDMETMSLALTFTFNQAPRGLVQVVMGFVTAAYLAPELMVMVMVLPLFILPLRRLGKRVKRSSRYTLKMRGEMTDVMHQQFGGIREIMGFRLEKLRQQTFQQSSESVFRGLMGVSRARAFSRAVVEGGGYLAVFTVIAIAVFIAIRLGKSFGEFTSFMLVISALIWNPLRTLSRAYNNFQNSLPGVTSIFSILDNPEPLTETENPKSFPKKIETITFDHLSYSYQGEASVLDQINFQVAQGQVIALVGPTGSGKSTLMDFIPRFRDPSQGHVLINGIRLTDFSIPDLRKHIAVVTQETYLFNTTIKDNLLLGNAHATDDHLWEILNKVHLDEVIKEKPEGLNFIVGERGNRLSGGQRQRLAIARALLKNAPILILDEATSAQDSVSEKNIQEALDILMKGRTTFVIAHRLSTVRHADLVLVLKEGRLIEKGTHEKLKSFGGEYATLYETQFLD